MRNLRIVALLLMVSLILGNSVQAQDDIGFACASQFGNPQLEADALKTLNDLGIHISIYGPEALRSLGNLVSVHGSIAIEELADLIQLYGPTVVRDIGQFLSTNGTSIMYDVGVIIETHGSQAVVDLGNYVTTYGPDVLQGVGTLIEEQGSDVVRDIGNIVAEHGPGALNSLGGAMGDVGTALDSITTDSEILNFLASGSGNLLGLFGGIVEDYGPDVARSLGQWTATYGSEATAKFGNFVQTEGPKFATEFGGFISKYGATATAQLGSLIKIYGVDATRNIGNFLSVHGDAMVNSVVVIMNQYGSPAVKGAGVFIATHGATFVGDVGTLLTEYDDELVTMTATLTEAIVNTPANLGLINSQLPPLEDNLNLLQNDSLQLINELSTVMSRFEGMHTEIIAIDVTCLTVRAYSLSQRAQLIASQALEVSLTACDASDIDGTLENTRRVMAQTQMIANHNISFHNILTTIQLLNAGYGRGSAVSLASLNVDGSMPDIVAMPASLESFSNTIDIVIC